MLQPCAGLYSMSCALEGQFAWELRNGWAPDSQRSRSLSSCVKMWDSVLLSSSGQARPELVGCPASAQKGLS